MLYVRHGFPVGHAASQNDTSCFSFRAVAFLYSHQFACGKNHSGDSSLRALAIKPTTHFFPFPPSGCFTFSSGRETRETEPEDGRKGEGRQKGNKPGTRTGSQLWRRARERWWHAFNLIATTGEKGREAEGRQKERARDTNFSRRERAKRDLGICRLLPWNRFGCLPDAERDREMKIRTTMIKGPLRVGGRVWICCRCVRPARWELHPFFYLRRRLNYSAREILHYARLRIHSICDNYANKTTSAKIYTVYILLHK